MKNIFHVLENVSFESGGVRTVLSNLDNFIQFSSENKSIVLSNRKEIDDENYTEFPSYKFKFWNYSKELKMFLNQNLTGNSCVHIHGVFMYSQYIASKIANKNNIPYVVTPHGMLEPWHLSDKKIKKNIYLKFFLNNILHKSKILHAITTLEKDNLYNLTKHKNIIEIPNFIHYNSIPKDLGDSSGDDYLLSLGRIHPKKGLDVLIESMSKIENKTIKLKIVGELNDYSNHLKKISKELKIENRVEFVGGVFGIEKYRLFSNAKAFVAPSYSEAIGMVNLEAAACNIPVITSYNTGISPDWNKNGGIMINPNTTEVIKSINTVLSWSDNERVERGNLLSKYVFENYSWEKKGYLWNELYDSL